MIVRTCKEHRNQLVFRAKNGATIIITNGCVSLCIWYARRPIKKHQNFQIVQIIIHKQWLFPGTKWFIPNCEHSHPFSKLRELKCLDYRLKLFGAPQSCISKSVGFLLESLSWYDLAFPFSYTTAFSPVMAWKEFKCLVLWLGCPVGLLEVDLCGKLVEITKFLQTNRDLTRKAISTLTLIDFFQRKFAVNPLAASFLHSGPQQQRSRRTKPVITSLTNLLNRLPCYRN